MVDVNTPQTVRLSASSIPHAVTKRQQYATLFEVLPAQVELSIKGHLRLIENDIPTSLLNVSTFRVVRELKQFRGVANARAKIDCNGATHWVKVPSEGGDIDVMLRYEEGR